MTGDLVLDPVDLRPHRVGRGVVHGRNTNATSVFS
jgi:hypothetical protein